MATLSTKIKLIDDMSEKLKGISTNGREVQQSLTEISTSANALDKVTSATEASTNAVTESSEAVEKYTECHNKSRQALEDYIDGVEGSKEELDKFIQGTDSASESTEALEEKLKKTSTQYEETQEETEKTSEKTKEYEQTTTEAMNTIESLIASAGIVMFLKKVADGYLECVTSASQYESSLAKVSTIADSSVLSMDSISGEISSLSQETGQSVNDLSEATYQAVSAGVDTANSVDFVNKANKLAVGGFTDATTAVDVLTTSLNAYNLKTSDTSKVSDYLVETQNLGKTTVDELSSTMGRVIPSAAAYNVQLSDLCTSYSILTANGIDTAEASTYLKGMFNELGDSSSNVSTILQDQTGESFSQLMTSGKSLGDIIEILSTSVNNDTTAFSNLWSSQEAGVGALSLLSSGTEKYNSTLNTMTSSSGVAEEAYKKMTNTSEYTSKAMQNAAENFKIAVGDAMLPATNKFNNAIADTLNNLTTFVTAHPGVVKAVAALTTGIGVATGTIVIYTAVTKLATVATAAFTAMSGPIGALVTILGAVAVGVTAWSLAQEDAKEETDGLTTSSKLQHEQLQQLNSEYETTCDKLGKNSYQAEELKAQIEDLSTSYDNNKQTMEDFKDTANDTLQAYYDTRQKYHDGMSDINDEKEATDNLIDRLKELGSKSNRTADEQMEMASVIDILNKKMPSLGLTCDGVTKNLDDTISKIKLLSSQDIAQDKYETATKAYNDLLEKQEPLLEKAKSAQNNLADAQTLLTDKQDALTNAQKAYDKATQDYYNNDNADELTNKSNELANANEELTKAQTDYNDVLQAANTTKYAYNDNLSETQNALLELSDAYAESNGIIVDSTDDAQQAVSAAAISVDSDLQALATAYDEAYNSALTSFQGQYNLWDQADEVSATSASTLNSNLDSQITYWSNYSSNLENLQNRNIKGLDALVNSMDDGSADSAAALAGMATASDSELQKMADKYGTLQGEQGKTADSVAKLETDFNGKMDSIKSKMESTVDGMNLSTEATKSAKSTIDAYVAEINSGVERASTAMASVVSAAKTQLGSSSTSGSSTPKHARGTDYAEDIFIAGEEGPELIVGHGGSKVFTAEETQNILSPEYNIPDTNLKSPSSAGTSSSADSSQTDSNKVITLRLEGVGSLNVGKNSGVNKSDIVDILTEQIKPVLINVLNDEMYEEADESYEY